jgi:hypothetical protein
MTYCMGIFIAMWVLTAVTLITASIVFALFRKYRQKIRNIAMYNNYGVVSHYGSNPILIMNNQPPFYPVRDERVYQPPMLNQPAPYNNFLPRPQNNPYDINASIDSDRRY